MKITKSDFKLILAFDFGHKKIGVASGNLITRTASPLRVIESNNKIPWNDINLIIKEWLPDHLVVGIPKKNSENEITKKCKKFSAELKKRYKLNVSEVDESFTSVEAKSILKKYRELGIKKKITKKTDIDIYSAVLIAEQWMMYE
ncbi:MAG: Holliday junction resolvase RuvX [Gammaproteobacteria bacterium TMED78]|nr:MAG: Holliday junction resolvase RuvX [Gammaproteobacteria bacterium TMED78]|tara:strand:+ start:352 stop:786 length:435 start_codon:yes stop_codon:yes gene_type:complete